MSLSDAIEELTEAKEAYNYQLVNTHSWDKDYLDAFRSRVHDAEKALDTEVIEMLLTNDEFIERLREKLL